MLRENTKIEELIQSKVRIEQLEKDKAIMYNKILEQQKIISNLNSKRKSDRIISLEEF